MIVVEKRSERVIREVAARRNISVKDLLGRCQFSALIDARRECMQTMHGLGMTHGNIAIAMKRHPSTVVQYLNPAYAARKSLRRSRPDLFNPNGYYWSLDDARRFTELYATVPNSELAAEFNRTLDAVVSMACKLGLRKTKRGRPPKKLKRWLEIAGNHEFTMGYFKPKAVAA